MKRVMIAAVAAVALAGCATSHDKYYEAIKAQAEATKAQQDRIEGQIAALAATGDAQAKGMAMAYWIMKGAKGGDSVARIQPPQDTALQWASILVPGLTNLYAINRNTSVQMEQIKAEAEQYTTTMGTLQGIATGAFNNPTYLPMTPSENPTYLPVTPGPHPLRPVEPTPTTTTPAE